MKPAATTIVTTAESPIEPTPSAAIIRREKRDPRRINSVALRKGIAGMIHKRRITSTPHIAQVVRIE
jgi:hypothetical protein